MFLTTQFSIIARNVLVAASVEVALSVCGAADTRSKELEGLYGDEKTLEIALGYRKPLVDVPNVATVIEEEDIRRVGARTLAEALVLAPGVQVVHGRGRIRLLKPTRDLRRPGSRCAGEAQRGADFSRLLQHFQSVRPPPDE